MPLMKADPTQVGVARPWILRFAPDIEFPLTFKNSQGD